MMPNRVIFRALHCAVAVVIFFALNAYGSINGSVASENVFEGAPFPFAHSSSIVELPGGDIFCVWFGGIHEKSSDTSIWGSRLSGGVWSKPSEIANGAELSERRFAAWNPVLWIDPGGRLTLSYKIGDSPRRWSGYFKLSSDGGKSWGQAQAYPGAFLGPTKNKPLVLKSGRTIMPSSFEFHSSFGWHSHFELSDDCGKTLKKTGFTFNPLVQSIQPALIERKDGSIVALMRTRNGYVGASVSKDGGETWTPARLLDVPNSNSGLDAAALSDGRFVMVCNPLPERRNKLSLMLSDDGLKWRESIVLDSGGIHEEYAYPAVIQASDGKIHITYTRNHTHIRHIALKPGDIK